MLQEGKYQFDILDDTADFQAYKLIILPDNIPVTGKLHQSLKEFLSHGGKLIASFASSMDEDKTHFVMDELGVSLSGEVVLDDWGNPVRGYPYPLNDYTDYLLPGPGFDDGLKQTEYVMYRRGMGIVAAGNAAILADRIEAYFDRTFRHYCSHMQTPSKGQSLGPGIVQNDQSIYFAHPIFSTYNDRAPIWCRISFFNALERFLPNPLVQVDGPSGLLATLNKQPAKNRLVLHLLYYVPERRATEFDAIEDIIPLHDLSVRLAVHDNVENIATAPQGQRIPFEKKEGQVSFTLPRLDGHQMIEIKLNG